MTDLQLQGTVDWFVGYTQTFASGDGRFHPPLQLKVAHSKRVADNARKLAVDLGWNPAEANGAEALGWLHDIGRFSQFAEFGTFTDATSINHGERGWEIIQKAGILSMLQPSEQKILLAGIRYHNAKTEPDHLNKESLRFLKLIRDADKLDIFHIVLDSVKKDGFQDLPGMLPQVNLAASLSPKVLREVQKHRSCSIEDVRSLEDFLLMQLSWIYDLNYPAALELVSERGMVGRIEQHLPKKRQVWQVVQTARKYIEENTHGKREHNAMEQSM